MDCFESELDDTENRYFGVDDARKEIEFDMSIEYEYGTF